MRTLTFAAAMAAASLLAACATPPPAPGTAAEQVLRDWGRPSARYALPAGAERLEYASGPYGRTTWMIDLDAAGRVAAARQVLGESNFLDVQTRAATGLQRGELLRWIGSPGERRHGGRQGGEVWSWRYPTNDCLWFQASVADDGRVLGAAYAIDPLCDAPSDRE